MVIANSNYLLDLPYNLLDVTTDISLDDIIAGLDGNKFLFRLNTNDALIGGLGNGTIDRGAGADWTGYSPLASIIALSPFGLANKGRLGSGLLANIEDIADYHLPAYLIDASGATSPTGSSAAINLSPGKVSRYRSYSPLALIMSQLKQAERHNLAGLITGNSTSNYLYGSAGDDAMRGGAGNENMGGSAGNDTIDGGRGTDTANYSSLGGPVSLGAFGVLNKGGLGIDTLVNIETIVGSDLPGDTIDHSAVISRGGVVVTGTSTNLTRGLVTVNGSGSPLPLSFKIARFENVIGSKFNDNIIGNASGNSLAGGAGNDTLIGAGGSDNLTGGAGADVFKYTSAAESAAGISKRDTITDFQLGIDKLDLTAIDANATLANDQAFSFLGNAGSFTSAGQLRYEVIGGNLLLFGNLDTNLGTSEFELQLTGLNFITAADIFP